MAPKKTKVAPNGTTCNTTGDSPPPVGEPPKRIESSTGPELSERSTGLQTRVRMPSSKVVTDVKLRAKGMLMPSSAALVEASASNKAETGVFIRMPQDLAGLIVSGWLVPTVKSPFKYVPHYIIALLMQGAFVGYVIDEIGAGWTPGMMCATPAFIQVVAVYVFGAAVFHGLTAHKAIQIARYSTHLKTDPGESKQYHVRASPKFIRNRLLVISTIDLFVELVVWLVGTFFLLCSSSVADVVLNSVAVNFISEIDELMLGAFVNLSAKTRLEKYLFNVPVGVEEGDTQLKSASKSTKRLAKWTARAPTLWLFLAIFIVALGQLVTMGLNPGTQCTAFSARRNAPGSASS